MIEKLIKW